MEIGKWEMGKLRRQLEQLDLPNKPCQCIGKVRYALKCSDICDQIFKEYQCPCAGSGTGYVKCSLYTDDVVSSSENMANWVTTYNGAPVETIQSILRHGEMVIADDVLLDGSYLEKRTATADEKPAIWTYPKFEGGENRTKVATYDNGETTFQMVLELRQRPDTFTKHMTTWGYEIYSTNRRGTIALWAVHIKMIKVKRAGRNQTAVKDTVPINPRPVTCHVHVEAQKALQSLKMPQGIFDNRFDTCYCSSCRPDILPKFQVIAGEKIVVPTGWVKFGVKVNESFAIMNDIWDSWNSAFHGCAPDKVLSILKHRSLLIPGDYMYNGTQLSVNSSSDPNQKCYFFSPTITYVSHPWYAQFKKLDDKYFQTVLFFKVRASSFDKQEETEGGEMKMYDDYSVIEEDEIEWCSSRRGCSAPYAILIRVVNKEIYDIITSGIKNHPNAKSYRKVNRI